VRKRKDAKALARWEAEAREWATNTARDLALDLYHSRETATTPYHIGVVLDPGEKAWAEVPVRFNLDWPVPVEPWRQGRPAVRSWLVTSARIVGRLADDRLHGYRWEKMVGARGGSDAGSRVCRSRRRRPADARLVRSWHSPIGRRRHLQPVRHGGRDPAPRPGPAACPQRMRGAPGLVMIDSGGSTPGACTKTLSWREARTNAPAQNVQAKFRPSRHRSAPRNGRSALPSARRDLHSAWPSGAR
jgi:hypothetical protein